MDKNIRLLIVDDEAHFLESMAYWFRSKGYFVTTASNGIDALRRIKQDPPDIVFLDLIMPEMDGAVTVKMVREFNNTLPIIMMSAYETESVVKKKVNFYGVFDFFDKSDDFSKAQALLESALRKNEELQNE